MKRAVTVARVLVGILFIISGLVKANDPLGLSYKMQEFFEVWNTDLAAGHFFLKTPLMALFTFLNGHSLLLSIGMIVLGNYGGGCPAGWVAKKSGIAAAFRTDPFLYFFDRLCVCLRQVQELWLFWRLPADFSPNVFLKDLVLVLLTGVLIAGQKHIRPILSRRAQIATLSIALLFSLGLQWYVLKYLPLADCLPFKLGASIAKV
jgi:hypothetical protein